MEKLKKIIQQLSDEKYHAFKEKLIANHSKKFLVLLEYYKNNNTEDLGVVLDSQENAVNVLKSRLYDRIQKHLLDDLNSEVTKEQIAPVLCFDNYIVDYPRDTAIAILHEFEKTYLQSNDFLNLINVYSSLKKAYHFSEKFYHYSQLYNKHVAYAISLEKANDVLLGFNKTLANYYYSDSENDLNTLLIYKDEIKNICFLNKSPNFEIIYNTIIIQLFLFAGVELQEAESVEDLFVASDNILSQSPNDPQINKFEYIMCFLKLEYYKRIGQGKKTIHYFEKLNENYEKWLLNNNYCISFKFLYSKLEIISANQQLHKLNESDTLYLDSFDFYTIVATKFYTSVRKYYSGNLKEAISNLNKILEDSSFVNFPYMDFEVKLTLAYFYYRKNEYELAANILKNLSRKVNAAEYSKYANVKTFIKMLNLLIDGKESKAQTAKLITLFEQFNYQNFSGRKILQHLQNDLNSYILKKN